jgi:hypothetical protein
MGKFSSKHNAGVRLFLFDIPEHYTYKDLKQLASEYGMDALHSVKAIYINKKGLYGPQPVIATGNEMVNAPGHMLDQVNEILNDAESVSLINGGYVGFKLYSYENKYGMQQAIEWIDIPETFEAELLSEKDQTETFNPQEEDIPF